MNRVTIGLIALLSMPALSATAQEPPAAAATDVPPTTTPPPATTPPAGATGASTGAFGSVGQIAISVDLPLTNEAPQLALYHESTSMGGSSSTNINIQPSLDYFVAPNVSVGGAIGVSHGGFQGADGVTQTSFMIEARGGYNVALMDTLSLWPHLGIAYQHTSVSASGTSQSGYLIPLVVSVPLLWHPASHFFLGPAVSLTTDLVAKVEGNDIGKTTDIGLTAVIGGYFGGT